MKLHQKDAFKKAAQQIIKNLIPRQIDASYYETSSDCLQAILSELPKDALIAWGGSETLKECELLSALTSNEYRCIDRTLAKTPEESRSFYAQSVMADYYFMSTNALTLDGELINIDGNGNRVACLIHGPSHVYLIVGRNKIVSDINSGYKRIKDFVAPANTERLNRKTPCYETGRCGDCFSPECICSHTVITRRCSQKGRIKIFLVNEDLGY